LPRRMSVAISVKTCSSTQNTSNYITRLMAIPRFPGSP
jgi:hypothetical protein